MFGKQGVSAAQMDAAIKMAVADATIAAAFAAHVKQCELDKAEMKAEHRAMHAENTRKLDLLFKIVWVAAGIMAAVSIGGKEVIAKLFGG